MPGDTATQWVITSKEFSLIKFIREMGWGEVRIRVENGQPILIYEAMKNIKLEGKSF